MFSKIRKIGSSFLLNNRPKNYFAKRPNPKEKMRTEGYARESDPKSKDFGYFHVGLYGFVFACCFAAIPLYRVSCEHVGLVGNYDKKTYEFKDQ